MHICRITAGKEDNNRWWHTRHDSTAVQPNRKHPRCHETFHYSMFRNFEPKTIRRRGDEGKARSVTPTRGTVRLKYRQKRHADRAACSVRVKVV